jgi:PD-(D/E)XK nuclease superfamily
VLIKGFFCTCVGRNVAEDHYSSGACKNPPMPIPWILGALHKEATDTVHQGVGMSPSRLAKCFRKTAIEATIPAIIDVRELDAAAGGTAQHEFMERHTPGGMLSEVEFPREGKPMPKIFEGTEYEITMRGRCDVLKLGGDVVLEDYKTTGEWSQKFRWERRTADPEWNVQASLYKILAKKCEGIDIKRACVWSGARVGKKSKAPAWFQIPITFMSEEEILEVKPLDGDYTVADNIREYKLFVQRIADGMSKEEAVRLIPLFGKTTKRFSECDYCSVRGACQEISGEVAW